MRPDRGWQLTDMLSAKDQFPIFDERPDLVYLDSAATALKPKRVIRKVAEYYQNYSANIHRGIYEISEKATEGYEVARQKVAKFINASSAREVVFVRNATEAVNLVAYAWGARNLRAGEEIALTVMEHHANLVPWQEVARERGAKLNFLDVDAEGKLTGEWGKWINGKTRLAAFTQASNVLGTINDVKEMAARVKAINDRALVLVDGAQAVPHLPVDISQFKADFYVFSGHKLYGPTGIGVLWGDEGRLREMSPFEYGGDMIEEVSLERSTFKEPPAKFEAGTPHIAGAIGLGEAVDFVSEIGMEKIREHEVEITDYALARLGKVKGLRILGPIVAKERSGLVAFTVENVHPHDLAQILDQGGVAIRAGNHCAMPIHTRFGVMATARASFGVYTSKDDIDRLAGGIEEAKKKLG